MGLVKVVLGEQGEPLAALAARDYFFDTPLKRAYFENFTNLIPMDRHGCLRESLRLAGEALQPGLQPAHLPRGHALARRASCASSSPTLGYLALTYGVDMLPLYLEGTYEALPKGSVFPKQTRDSRSASAPRSASRSCAGAREGMARSESYRLVTRVAEEAVKRAARGRRVLARARRGARADPGASAQELGRGPG